ncbi:MAG: hypothetical protein L6R42_007580 [Xanthoria sp. 1 TBL-2021]|nr:MAG: hypothetical protein L6R42_007580 [Xanthoria sp. 1 TBL-2021]
MPCSLCSKVNRKTGRYNETNSRQSTAVIPFVPPHNIDTTAADSTSPSNIAALNEIFPTALTYRHPLRSHGNVMGFVEKPAAFDSDRTTEELRPIEDLPFDLSEGDFARVKFLVREYWMTRDREDDDVLVEKEKGYVVVLKEVDMVTIVLGD